MTITNKSFQNIVILIMFLAAFFFLMWSAYFEKPFLFYLNQPFPVKNAVRAGEVVPMYVERCSRSKVLEIYDTIRALENTDGSDATLLSPHSTVIAPGCHNGLSSQNIVPPGTKPGLYYIKGIAIVPGLIVAHRIPFKSEIFEVIP